MWEKLWGGKGELLPQKLLCLGGRGGEGVLGSKEKPGKKRPDFDRTVRFKLHEVEITNSQAKVKWGSKTAFNVKEGKTTRACVWSDGKGIEKRYSCPAIGGIAGKAIEHRRVSQF